MRRRSFLLVAPALGLILLTTYGRADWGPVKRLTWTAGESYLPAVAVDSEDVIHLVWHEYVSDEDNGIYYRRSVNGGETWSRSKRLSRTSVQSDDPAIAIDSNDTIHVVWAQYAPDDEIFYRRSLDGGMTWSGAQRISWTSGSSQSPGITPGPANGIHIVWEDETPGSSEVYYKQSTDAGASWGSGKRLTWTSGSSRSPVVAVGPDNDVHVAWHDFTPGDPQIYYRRSTDSGVSWAAARRLTWTSGGCWRPVLGLGSANAVHIVWQGGSEIYYKKSADGGETWGANKRLSWTTGASWSPGMALDSSATIHVVWGESTPGNFEVCYKKSTDGGETWSANKRLSWTSGESTHAVAATDSGNIVHIAWQDDTPGNSEIYYKKGN